jgi:hypothetical protein
MREESMGAIERIEKPEISEEKREDNHLRRRIFFEYVGGEMRRQLRSFNELIVERQESDTEYKVYLQCTLYPLTIFL